jgi:hypothetical protein
MPVSFSKDVKPMFREVDIDHMKVHGVHLDDYQYMSDATNNCANAQAVQDSLAGQTMPHGGHSGPRSSSVSTTSGGRTDISREGMISWSILSARAARSFKERNSARPAGMTSR